jgi:CrcB protein
MKWLNYIAIGSGGALGAMLRVFMAKILPNSIHGIPTYIMLVNIIGCFIMGALAELLAMHWSASENMRYFLVSGFLGGFTTFSAFALEFGLLCEKQFYLQAAIYASLTFVLGLASFFFGLKLIRLF